jgi:hypothetical protein
MVLWNFWECQISSLICNHGSLKFLRMSNIHSENCFSFSGSFMKPDGSLILIFLQIPRTDSSLVLKYILNWKQLLSRKSNTQPTLVGMWGPSLSIFFFNL